jgi:hypothetical protein
MKLLRLTNPRDAPHAEPAPQARNLGRG